MKKTIITRIIVAECLLLLLLLCFFALFKGTLLTSKVKMQSYPYKPLYKDNSERAEIQIEMYVALIETYKNDTGQYPTTAAGLSALLTNVDNVKGWQGPYARYSTIANDPWKRPFHYQSPGLHGPYDLYSYGSDGLRGGKGENKDITSSDLKNRKIK